MCDPLPDEPFMQGRIWARPGRGCSVKRHVFRDVGQALLGAQSLSVCLSVRNEANTSDLPRRRGLNRRARDAAARLYCQASCWYSRERQGSAGRNLPGDLLARFKECHSQTRRNGPQQAGGIDNAI